MNKLIKMVTSRLVVTGILILIQIFWLLLMFLQLLDQVAWLGVVITLLSAFLALFVISRDENPAYKLGWVLLITILPILGGPMYIMFGNKRPARNMRMMMEKEQKRSVPNHAQEERVMGALAEADPRVAGTARYIAKRAGFPVFQHSKTRYYALGDDMYVDMIEDLKRAKHYIFMEYFIIDGGVMWDSILNILTRKVKEGVDVRLMYDDMGSLSLLPVGYAQQMEERGIKCIAFNRFVPLVSLVMNNRDHRKIMVVDGHVGYTGGINLADEYINQKVRFGHWKDTGVRIEGDAVWNLTLMFLEMWNTFRLTDENYLDFRPHKYHTGAFETDGFVQPFGDSPLDNEPVSENVYIELLAQARDYVYIFTPYLVIDYDLQTAICMAAKRGVDVHVVTPGIPDKKIVYQLTRSYYPSLIREGVHVHEYTPGFLHAKSFVVDDKLAVVGTINLDFRSLYLHFECGAFLYGCECIKAIRDDSLHTIRMSREIALEDCRQGFWGSLLNAILRAFAPML